MAKPKILTEEEEKFMQQYESEVAQAQANGYQSQIPYSAAMFGGGQKQNLIEWELDFKPELDAIESLLRCDVYIRGPNGRGYWAPNPDKDRILFNDVGISDILRNIVILVNKNKALSNYDDEEINARVGQIKHELRILIYNNYEDYGMDNEYKMNNYSMIIMSIGSIIEDVYRRAMNGATHQGLGEQRLVQQNEPLMPQGMNFNFTQPQQKKGIFSRMAPWNWGKG